MCWRLTWTILNVNIAGVTFWSTLWVDILHFMCVQPVRQQSTHCVFKIQGWSCIGFTQIDYHMFTCQIFWGDVQHPPIWNLFPSPLRAALPPLRALPRQSFPGCPHWHCSQPQSLPQKWLSLEPHVGELLRLEQTHCWWNVHPWKMKT